MVGARYIATLLKTLLLARFNAYLVLIDPTEPLLLPENVFLGERDKIAFFPSICIVSPAGDIENRQLGHSGLHRQAFEIHIWTYSEESDQEKLEISTWNLALALKQIIFDCAQLDDITGTIVKAIWEGEQFVNREEDRRAFISGVISFLNITYIGE